MQAFFAKIFHRNIQGKTPIYRKKCGKNIFKKDDFFKKKAYPPI
jgi:hypothetical protein